MTTSIITDVIRSHSFHRQKSRGKMGKSKISTRAKRTYANRDWFIRQLQKNLTIPQIAQKARVSEATICKWKSRHGFVTSKNERRNYLSPVAEKTYGNRVWLTMLVDHGCSISEICEQVEKETGNTISKETLGLWLFRFELQIHNSCLTKEAHETYASKSWLTARVAEGLSDEEIGSLLKDPVIRATIHRWRKRFRISRPFFHQPKNEAERKKFGLWLSARIIRLPLTEVEQNILKRYYGIDGPVERLVQIKKSLHCTVQRVLQIIYRALGKIILIVGTRALSNFPEILKHRKAAPVRFVKKYLPKRVTQHRRK